MAARRWWLGLAQVLQAGSVVTYAEQQRRLLTGLGGAMSPSRAVAVSLARTALSSAMPAGGPVSTAYAVRQFRVHGLTGASALAATLLASVQASAATLLVYLGWSVASGRPTAALALLGVGLVYLIVSRTTRIKRSKAHNTIARFAVDTVRACGSLSRRDWLRAGAAAVARRLFDLACLVAAASAFGLDTGTMPLVGAYLAGLVVRQIPLAAGGAGLVEASLLAFLVNAGADAPAAAALVLTYRLLSCWLVALAGVPALLTLGLANRSPSGVVDSGELLAPGGDVRGDGGRVVQSAGDQAGEVGHVVRCRADADDLRGTEAQAVDVAVDRAVGKADPAGEHVGAAQPLGGVLAATP
jgi:uncharacterized membrane protein YbhN (UPF0104 family)